MSYGSPYFKNCYINRYLNDWINANHVNTLNQITQMNIEITPSDGKKRRKKNRREDQEKEDTSLEKKKNTEIPFNFDIVLNRTPFF